MKDRPVDLRSDTVTKPTHEMRAAIANADVGDDVIDVDPTVARLESFTAEVLGKEAAIYMPSGSMTNQVAVRVHCKPGDEFLCEADCHIFNYEQGAFAQLSGVVAHPVQGDGGVLQPEQLQGLIRPDNEHLVRTRLVCLENTHNRGAGRVQPYEIVESICGWAKQNGIGTHLDGARLFNAVAATGISAADWSQHFDTVSVCYSKGLGAPVGSALAGSKVLIQEARRHRKLFGGGMRQAGIIAAGALYAMEHHRERMGEDHANAQILAAAIRNTEGLNLEPDLVESNMAFFSIDPAVGTAVEVVAAFEQRGVLVLATAPNKIRLVTHLDVNESQVRQAAEIIPQVVERLVAGERPATDHVAAY